MSNAHEKLVIGVLALQGAFREHAVAIEKCGAQAHKIRRRRELASLDALIIPGGESTTIGKLMVSYHLLDEIKRLGAEGLPMLGTCAGLVMLAREVVGGDQPLLGLMDIKVRRNAFGRQVKSFEAALEIPALAAGAPETRARDAHATNALAQAAHEHNAHTQDTHAKPAVPFPGIFIRAPWIESAGPSVDILVEYDGHGIAARQDNMLVTACIRTFVSTW